MVLCLVLKFSARGRFIPVLTALSAAELVGKEIAAMPQALLCCSRRPGPVEMFARIKSLWRHMLTHTGLFLGVFICAEAASSRPELALELRAFSPGWTSAKFLQPSSWFSPP